MTADGAHSPETLGALLKDCLLLAESGQFDAAQHLLLLHDQAVRAGSLRASASEIPRWRVLHEAQQRALDRLCGLRDAAGRELATVGRARRVADAYQQTT